jgi:ABC-type lipoprotein export system ATPase subunit
MMLLTELNRAGKTIIMVTHENDIAAWAHRVVRLRDGKIESETRNEAPQNSIERVGQEASSAAWFSVPSTSEH